MAVNATWVWVRQDRPPDPTAAARFARKHGVHTSWVSVPWHGPDKRVLAVADAMRGEGLTGTALGGGPDWAEHPERAADWARRAVTGRVFTSVHLDIEPWTLPSWPIDADRLLAGTVSAVHLVTEVTGAPVTVDLAPHLALTHPDGFAEVARTAGNVTLMSYRTTPAAILGVAMQAVQELRSLRRPYRLAVDTLPSAHPEATFAGRRTAYLHDVTAEVSRRLSGDPLFTGFAVHDLQGWLGLPA